MGSFLGDEVAAVQLVAAESLGLLVPDAGDVILLSEPVLAPDRKEWTADSVAGVGPAGLARREEALLAGARISPSEDLTRAPLRTVLVDPDSDTALHGGARYSPAMSPKAGMKLYSVCPYPTPIQLDPF